MSKSIDGVARPPWEPSLISRPARRAFRTVWQHLVVEDPLPTSAAAAIFCFGSRHVRVPERAAALYRAGTSATVLITGGPAAPGEPTESSLIGEELVALGVPVGAIIEEPLARHTAENVELGMQALAARGIDSGSGGLVLVSWPLASRRVLATFARHHPEVATVSAPALRRPGWRWCPTPRRINLALGELDRLDRYGELGWIAPVPASAEVQEAADVLRLESARLRCLAEDSPGLLVEPTGPEVEAEQSALLDVEV